MALEERIIIGSEEFFCIYCDIILFIMNFFFILNLNVYICIKFKFFNDKNYVYIILFQKYFILMINLK